MTIPPIGVILTAILSQILYPYSRFVYHSVMDFIFGNNMFVVNALLMLILKFLMMICWFFAIFIAPIGLLYLYYHHTKEEKKLAAEEQKHQDMNEQQ